MLNQARNENGAYILKLKISKPIRLIIGALCEHDFREGEYFYIGSARNGIQARVERHLRLATSKCGGGRWHIDYLLRHRDVRVVDVERFPGGEECVISKRISERPRVSVPLKGFGSSDCRNGCPAHLYYREAAKQEHFGDSLPH